jgi:hypothetical protein
MERKRIKKIDKNFVSFVNPLVTFVFNFKKWSNEMKISKILVSLSILTGLLALIQAGAGLFWQNGGSPFPFTTLHGETVQMYGQGIYRYDTYFKAPIFRGTDAVTFFLGVPLLAIAIWLYNRGTLRGELFLAGVLAYFAYNSTSVTLGVAYNNLFLEYIAYFSASLFAFVLAVTSIDIQGLSNRISSNLPRRGIAVLLFVAGGALLFAWLSDLIAWLQPGAIPGVTSYTTEITHAIDLGIIAPLTFLSGILILRRAPLGYLLSTILLLMLAVIGVVVTVQTVFQLGAGIELAPGLIMGKAGSFAILSLFAVWFLYRIFHGISEPRISPGMFKQTSQLS